MLVRFKNNRNLPISEIGRIFLSNGKPVGEIVDIINGDVICELEIHSIQFISNIMRDASFELINNYKGR